MLTELLLLLSGLSLTCAVVLLAPLAVGLVFPIDGDRVLRDFLCRLLTHRMCEGAATLAAVVANYAFMSGMLLSLVVGKASTSLTTITGGSTGSNVRSPRRPRSTSSTSPYTDGSPPLVSFARHVVGVAFDQGYGQRFSWPPVLPYVSSSLRPRYYSSVSTSVRDGLVRCVWPKTTVFLGMPLLVCLCIVCAIPPLRALNLAIRDAVLRSEELRATAPQRVRAWLRETTDMLRDKAQPVVDWVVDTIAPFLFGVMLVLTTSVGIVLYGVGHVGIATVAQSGIFGLNLASVRAMVWGLWRLLFHLDWAWGWRTLFGLERRHRHRQHQHQRFHKRGEDTDTSPNHHRFPFLHKHHAAPWLECDCPHQHLGDHLHGCALRRHHYRRRSSVGSDYSQSRHEHHRWHHRHQPQHSLSEQELKELEELEEQEMRRELLRIRLQRRGAIAQTDGSSSVSDLGFSSSYRDSYTQTNVPGSSTYRYQPSPPTARHPSPFAAFPPSPELGEIPPRQPPFRWQATVEEELEAEARETEAQEASGWESPQATATDLW